MSVFFFFDKAYECYLLAGVISLSLSLSLKRNLTPKISTVNGLMGRTPCLCGADLREDFNLFIYFYYYT
jgi:hypothetical protein